MSSSSSPAACFTPAMFGIVASSSTPAALEVPAGAGRDVVEDHGHRARLGDRPEVRDDAGLATVARNTARRSARRRVPGVPASACTAAIGAYACCWCRRRRSAVRTARSHTRAHAVDDGALLVGVERGRLARGPQRARCRRRRRRGTRDRAARSRRRATRAVGGERCDERHVHTAQAHVGRHAEDASHRVSAERRSSFRCVSEPWRTIADAARGLRAPACSPAMFGVGGAVVSTPAIRALGATPLEGIGSTLPSILPSAISGSLRYHREGLIASARRAFWTTLAGVVASVGGALARRRRPRRRPPADDPHRRCCSASPPTAPRDRPSANRHRPRSACPTRSATSSNRPSTSSPRTRTGRTRDPADRAVAARGDRRAARAAQRPARRRRRHPHGPRVPRTGAAHHQGGGRRPRSLCVGILAIPGTITHALLGNIDWAFALPLCDRRRSPARRSARTSRSDRPTARLRLSVGIVLGVIAVVYAVGEVLALA